MAEIFWKLGVDWKILIAQAVNFLALLLVLRMVAYRPLLKLLADRRARIAQGLRDAEEATRRLVEAERERMQKVKEGEEESMRLVRAAEARAKEAEAILLKQAHEKESGILERAEAMREAAIEEGRARLYREAAVFMKRAIAQAVESDGALIDELLLEKAVTTVKEARKA